MKDLMKNKTYILPGYAVLPMILMLALNCITYFDTRLFTTGLYHHNISIGLDDKIPFLPIFIIPYILAYLQWILGYVAIGRESKPHCYTYMTAEMITKLLACITFVLLPTTLIRPDIVSRDIFSQITAYIYQIDAADNLFPSIHCIESYVCMRGIWKCKKVSMGWKIACSVMTVLVFMSIVFVKQHVVLDMIGAVVYFEAALLISKRIYKGKFADV